MTAAHKTTKRWMDVDQMGKCNVQAIQGSIAGEEGGGVGMG